MINVTSLPCPFASAAVAASSTETIFWIGVAICVIGGIIGIVSGLNSRYGGGSEVFTGLMMLILGPLVVRIYCELLIIIFRIHETLVEIKKNTEPTPPQIVH